MVRFSWLYAFSVFCPPMRSSTNPFNSPSFFDRARNSGLVNDVIFLVKKMASGTVTAKTNVSRGEIISIIASDPITVAVLAKICTISVESEVLIVSISYEIRLSISPVWWVSKYPTGNWVIFEKTWARMWKTTWRLTLIIMRLIR